MLSTGAAPKRSATAPANGCAAPHSSIWIARANANTSRPQPCALDIGERKNPNAERGPKPSRLIKQPHIRMTIGVRRETSLATMDLLGVREHPSSAGSDGNQVVLRRPPVARPYGIRPRKGLGHPYRPGVS